MAAIPKRASARISAGVRKYQKVFQAAKGRDINESDTVVIIADFLSEVLGFDKYTEVTTEFAIRGTYCDLAVKTDGKVRFLIEAKAIGVTLKEAHLRQAIGYASQQGVEWVVLTNGGVWRVYKIRFEKPVKTEMVFALDMIEASHRSADVVQRLFTLSREGLSRSAMEEFHEEMAALNPFLVGAVLRSEAVLSVVRRELRRVMPGAKVPLDDLAEVLREDVLKRDVVEGEEARLAGGRTKRAASRQLRKRVKKADADALTGDTATDRPLPAA